jgi:hypothetical protein
MSPHYQQRRAGHFPSGKLAGRQRNLIRLNEAQTSFVVLS